MIGPIFQSAFFLLIKNYGKLIHVFFIEHHPFNVVGIYVMPQLFIYVGIISILTLAAAILPTGTDHCGSKILSLHFFSVFLCCCGMYDNLHYLLYKCYMVMLSVLFLTE